MRLKAGERAPSDGRWLKEEFFILWWQTHKQLEAQREILGVEVEMLIKDKARLTSDYNAALARFEAERAKSELLRMQLDVSKKAQSEMWTTESVIKIAGGSAAIGVVVTLIVLGVGR